MGAIPIISIVIHRFLVIDNLFTRYTIVIGLDTGIASVYCEECEEWVIEFPHEMLAVIDKEDLYEKIISEHSDDEIAFTDSSINLI